MKRGPAGLLLLLASLCACTMAWALDADRPLSTFHHTKWTVEDGAPPDVWAMAQTPDGWLWLGNPMGLYRFDGIRFEQVALTDSAASIRSHAISVLFVADNGDLWIGYVFGGATRLRNGQATHYGATEGLEHGTVIAFEEDTQGNLWAPCANGFLRFDGERWETVGAQWNYPDPHAWNVYKDGRGRLWVAGDREIYYLEPRAKSFKQARLTARDENPSFTQSPDGRLWYGTSAGMAPLPDQDGMPPRAANHGQRTSYVSLIDRDGALWTVSSTASGLQRIARLKPGPLPTDAETYAGRASATPAVTKTLLEDREGNIWLTTTDSVERFRHANVLRPQIPFKGTLALAAADNGAMWIGGIEGLVSNTIVGLWKFDGAMHRLQPQLGGLSMLHKDRSGQLWIGGPGGIWRSDGSRFDPLPPLPEGARGQRVHQLSIDAAGDVWAGVVRSHLFRLKDGAWQKLGGRNDLPDKRPLAQAADDNGELWFAYDDGSLVIASADGSRRFDASDGLKVGIPTALHVGTPTLIGGEEGTALMTAERFIPLRFAQDPVALEGVTGILRAPDGSLWLNGMRGAVRIPPGQLDRAVTDGVLDVSGEVFDADDGYPGIAQRIRPVPTIAQGSDGRLWFVGVNGIGVIDPSKIRRNDMPPPLTLMSIVADGKSVPSANKVTLKPGTRNLSVAYTALSLSRPESVRFRYRLEGFDDAWVDAGTRREAFYTNLAPGQYRFRVSAANENGVWNESGVDLTMTVPPTFLQTPFFKVLCALLAAALLWFAYAIRVRQIRRREHARLEARIGERERIARELHDTLLQGMQGMILRFAMFAKQVPAGDPMRPQLERALDRAESLLSDGRDRVQDLRVSDNAQTEFADALRDAGRELAAESGMQLDVIVNEAPQPLHPMVRYECERIALEALANACKHSGARSIKIVLNYGPRDFALQVVDDGIGIDEQILQIGKTGHFGLPGMRERASRVNAQLSVRNSGGTTIAVSVPGRAAYMRA